MRVTLVTLVLVVAVSVSADSADAARPPKAVTVDFTGCRVDTNTVRLSITWSNLNFTNGEFFVNTGPIAPPATTYQHTIFWKKGGNSGSYSADIKMLAGEIADHAQVNLYYPDLTWVQRNLGVGDSKEEIPSCP